MMIPLYLHGELFCRVHYVFYSSREQRNLRLSFLFLFFRKSKAHWHTVPPSHGKRIQTLAFCNPNTRCLQTSHILHIVRDWQMSHPFPECTFKYTTLQMCCMHTDFTSREEQSIACVEILHPNTR